MIAEEGQKTSEVAWCRNGEGTYGRVQEEGEIGPQICHRFA